MTETTTVTITKAWKKISAVQCEVQSINDRSAYDKILFDLSVGETEPASDTNAFMRITLFEVANFHRAAPVWLRLNTATNSTDQPIVVTKESL